MYRETEPRNNESTINGDRRDRDGCLGSSSVTASAVIMSHYELQSWNMEQVTIYATRSHCFEGRFKIIAKRHCPRNNHHARIHYIHRSEVLSCANPSSLNSKMKRPTLIAFFLSSLFAIAVGRGEKKKKKRRRKDINATFP